MGVLLRHGGRIVANEFSCHGIRHTSRLEQGGGRVPQRVKADFILFTRGAAAFAGTVMAALAGESSGNKYLVKLVAQVSSPALSLQHRIGVGENRCGGVIAGRERFLVYLRHFHLQRRSLGEAKHEVLLKGRTGPRVRASSI